MARYCASSLFLDVLLSVRLAFSKRSWPYLAAGAYFNGSLVGPARELGMGVVSRLRSDAPLRIDNPD